MTTFGAYYTCAGHWTLAGQMAGLNPDWHYSPFSLAERTLLRNYGHGMLVTNGEKLPEVDVMTGSPPCVGFTRANPNRHNQHDDRQHVLRYAEQVVKLGPEISVMEMCTGWSDFPEQRKYHRVLQDGGYKTRELELDAWDYGGTQKRLRAFVIAVRDGRDIYGLKFRRRPGLDPVKVIAKVKDPGRYWVPDGKTKGPFGLALKWEKRRLVPGRPSFVITQSALKTIYHPTEKRSLGINEVAAVMGFPPRSERPKPPETYWLPDNTTAMNQIGPGVDIRAVAHMLEDVKAYLRT